MKSPLSEGLPPHTKGLYQANHAGFQCQCRNFFVRAANEQSLSAKFCCDRLYPNIDYVDLN